MQNTTPTRQQLIEEISKLPSDILPELADFLSYLRHKSFSLASEHTQVDESARSGAKFLLSIAGLGESQENDISERDEEILSSEIDPIRGWRLKHEE